MKYSLLFFLFFQSLIFCQPFPPKQITNFDFDARNVSFINYPGSFPWYETDIFFEGIKGPEHGVYYMTYDTKTDSFYGVTKVFSDSSVNRNLRGAANYENEKIVLWETNKNGNWDIIYSMKNGEKWEYPKNLFSSEEDELDAQFLLHKYYPDVLKIIFSKGKSIFLFSLDSLRTEELIFQGNDTVVYSNPDIAEIEWHEYYAVAKRKNNNGEFSIILKYKNSSDSLWGAPKVLYTGNMIENLKFIDLGGPMVLSFEAQVNGKKQVKWIEIPSDAEPVPFGKLLDDDSIETTDFSLFIYPIIGKRNEFYSYYPYIYKFIRNDSIYVKCGYFQSLLGSLDYNTKVQQPNPAVGGFGMNDGEYVSYRIWEDSSNSRINLFGLRSVDPIASIENEKDKMGFSLSQNYPNPFNPVTKIRYKIGSIQYATLKVYDILGNEITTLVNEEKPAGEYVVEFNGAGFASGIYFYTLRSGNYVLKNKAILLK